MRLAIEDFQHRGECLLGEPYGACSKECGWYPVRQVSPHEVFTLINHREWPDSYADVPYEQIKWLFKQLEVK